MEKNKNAIGIPDLTYDKHYFEWQKIHDFLEGQGKVKEVAVEKNYITLPAGMKTYTNTKQQCIKSDMTNAANDYIERSFFPQLVAPALTEASGRIFQQEPKYPVFPDNYSYLNDNITGDDVSIKEIVSEIVDILNSTTRCGILVDYSNTPEDLTLSEAEAIGSRLYWTLYKEMQISKVRVDNTGKPTLIVLNEKYTIPASNIEEQETVLDSRRALFIEEGIYKQRVYVYSKEKKDYIRTGEDIIPLMNSMPLNFIPFFFFNGKTNNHKVYKSRLLDITNTIESLYKNWADLEHLVYNICVPVRYATGLTSADKKEIKKVGPSSFFTATNPDATFGVMDIDGKGLDYCQSNIKEKLEIAKRQGYVFLDTGLKTATQIVSETTGRLITLQDVANSTMQGINDIMRFSCMWINIEYNEEEHRLEINLKTEDSAFEANNFTALINAVMKNLARLEDMHKYQLEKKITSEQDFKVWKQSLEENLMLMNPEGIDEL